MTRLQAFILFIGRILLSSIFLVSAFYFRVTAWGEYVQSFENSGLPYSYVLFIAATAIYAIGGLMLFLGWKTRLAGFLLLVTLAFQTYVFHDFWTKLEPADILANQKIFFTQLAIAGGLFYVLASGPGCFSCDGKKCAVKEIDEDE